MKILHVVDKMNPKSGGVCQAVRSIIKGLQELNVQNEVVSLDEQIDDFIIEDNFSIYALGPSKTPWSYSAGVNPWLRENIDRFDIVVLHGLWLYSGYAVDKTLKKLRVKGGDNEVPKLYIMPHGMLDPYFQNAPERRIKALRNKIYWKYFESKIVNDADALLFTCDQERLLARAPFKSYNPKQEIVVGLGIEEPLLHTPQITAQFLKLCPEVKGKNYLLFLSRIHEKKGVDLLIKAYLQLKQKYTQEELPLLVIAGPGLATDYGKALQQLVKQNQEINESVFFPGMLSGDAKWGAFYGCEAFVLPSHQENFGIAVVEALACGKPVLISDQINIWREIVGSNAGKVAADTLQGTSDLLASWIKLSPKEKNAMGEQAGSCFSKHFSITPNALRFKDAISMTDYG